MFRVKVNLSVLLVVHLVERRDLKHYGGQICQASQAVGASENVLKNCQKTSPIALTISKILIDISTYSLVMLVFVSITYSAEVRGSKLDNILSETDRDRTCAKLIFKSKDLFSMSVRDA